MGATEQTLSFLGLQGANTDNAETREADKLAIERKAVKAFMEQCGGEMPLDMTTVLDSSEPIVSELMKEGFSERELVLVNIIGLLKLELIKFKRACDDLVVQNMKMTFLKPTTNTNLGRERKL